ncbi:transcriptional regulator family: bZIP [Paecilomyces variotii]|nr:transcriptional regulator family: bZIP [Paecilomyces variotii]
MPGTGWGLARSDKIQTPIVRRDSRVAESGHMTPGSDIGSHVAPSCRVARLIAIAYAPFPPADASVNRRELPVREKKSNIPQLPMATPTTVSTPSSAGSPPALAPVIAARPALSIKPAISAAPATSPAPGTPGSVTTKEWVIPPRPKPGRKPATDTPPTKRKAQNRAAQRAFRERRAARVGELEEQIKNIEEENASREASFKEQIDNLSTEVEQCRNEISWWKDRCHALEKEVAVERSAKETLAKELRSSSSSRSNATPDIVPLPPRRSARNIQTAREASSAQPVASSTAQDAQQDVPSGCNNCSQARCQCIEDAFNINTITSANDSSSQKRAHSPSTAGGKRLRTEPDIKTEPEEMEIDFTSRFAMSSRAQVEEEPPAASPHMVDPCGFCQDGTPCICAEMAAQDREESQRRDSFENTRLAPIQNLSQFTPPPSEGDVRSELTLPSINQAANPCANGPGTCAQCQADPRSTLFCKTLAASRSASASSGCCGGKGADGGCCQSRPATRNSSQRTESISSPSLTLTCADTFTTLSRHPKFSRATDELAAWLPKLHTLPNPRDVAPKDRNRNAIDNRPAMEVEAASVMGVLRYFDRRFADK